MDARLLTMLALITIVLTSGCVTTEQTATTTSTTSTTITTTTTTTTQTKLNMLVTKEGN